jgi:ABC-type antimicrobial peptide transport system permease subunit
MTFILPVAAMGATLVIAILTAVVSAVYPADKASKQNIVESIRQ